MKKEYLLGGLAVVGAIALIMYLKPKPKKNSDGFFGANGSGGSLGKSTKLLCVKTNPDGSHTSYSQQGGNKPCPYGGVLMVLN